MRVQVIHIHSCYLPMYDGEKFPRFHSHLGFIYQLKLRSQHLMCYFMYLKGTEVSSLNVMQNVKRTLSDTSCARWCTFAFESDVLFLSRV